jgi:hypothetical protein
LRIVAFIEASECGKKCTALQIWRADSCHLSKKDYDPKKNAVSVWNQENYSIINHAP